MTQLACIVLAIRIVACTTIGEIDDSRAQRLHDQMCVVTEHEVPAQTLA